MSQPSHEHPLVKILDRTADRLRASFAEAREAINHNLTAGQEAEKVLSKFLRENLPQGVGVTTGEVVDVNGERSRQLDVILYDASRTPMLFAGPSNDTHIVPAEGVLAVIEVKTKLRSGDLPSIVENCRSIKRLARTAYFNQPIQIGSRMYGQEWTDAPVYYSVFAAESQNLYAEQLNLLLADVPAHERIDSVCCLDRGVNIWLDIDTSRGIGNPSTIASPRALVSGALGNIETPRPLLMWYAMLSGSVMETDVRPINISAYLQSELSFEATVPQGPQIEQMRTRLVNELAADQGVSPELLRKFSTGESLNRREIYDLLRAPGFEVGESGPTQLVQLRAQLQELARQLSFEEWNGLVEMTGLDTISEPEPPQAPT